MEEETINSDLTNLLLLIILIITIIANGIQSYFYKGNERFDWTSGVKSSEGNMIQVSTCDFNGNSYDIDKDMILDNGWEKINECENSMKETFFPDSLSIKWFSYNEKKFYKGNFALPKETILVKAAQLGILPSKKEGHITVARFITEVKQKGKLLVWLQKAGYENDSIKLLIGTYQAKETKTRWNILDDYLESDNNIDINITKKVNLVMDRYSYKLEIKLPNGYILHNSNFEFFNQKILRFNEREPKRDSILNFLPEGFYLEWGNGRKKFNTQFSFDEDEVLDVFSRESGSKLEPLILELTVNNANSDIKVMLTNSKTIFKDKYKSKNERKIIQLRN